MNRDTDIKGQAILFSEMTPPEGREDEFNLWYDEHHSPSHVKGVPGFKSALRYKADAGPHYLAIYELTSPGALEHEEYKKRKLTPDHPTYEMLKSVSGFTRYIAQEEFWRSKTNSFVDEIDAQIIFCEFYMVPIENQQKFSAWVQEEKVLHLTEESAWLMTRGLNIVEFDPEPYTHVLLHYFADAAASKMIDKTVEKDTGANAGIINNTGFEAHTVAYRRRRNRFLKHD